mmetsp:Transcript_29661/g.74174  ORF Transcript_29661/g.74174 Transcript_29661/m.74174 type:complete len:227 (-) Transcript_29661:9-689(-)
MVVVACALLKRSKEAFEHGKSASKYSTIKRWAVRRVQESTERPVGLEVCAISYSPKPSFNSVLQTAWRCTVVRTCKDGVTLKGTKLSQITYRCNISKIDGKDTCASSDSQSPDRCTKSLPTSIIWSYGLVSLLVVHEANVRPRRQAQVCNVVHDHHSEGSILDGSCSERRVLQEAIYLRLYSIGMVGARKKLSGMRRSNADEVGREHQSIPSRHALHRHLKAALPP